MITYPLQQSDIGAIKVLWQKFYQNDFPFPDLSKNFISTFKIVDDNFKLILAGGVKLNPELILLTDKDKSAIDRAFALISALQIATLASGLNGHELLHVSVNNDDKWLEQLKSYGFRDSRGTHLIIG